MLNVAEENISECSNNELNAKKAKKQQAGRKKFHKTVQ